MLGLFQDWLDEITGYNREMVRFVFVIVVINLVLFFILFSPWHWFEGDSCNALCQQNAERIIQETVPELAGTPDPNETPTPFDADRFIRDTLTQTP